MRIWHVTAVVGLGLTLLQIPPLQAQRAQLQVSIDSLVARAARDSNDAPAQYELALAYWVKHKYDLAEQQLRRAILIEPKTAQAYLALSYLPYARRPKLWDEEDNGKIPAEWTAAVEEAWGFRRRAFLLDPLVDLKPLALMIPPAEVLHLGRSSSAVYTYIMNGFGSFWDGQYPRAYQFFHDITGKDTDADRQKYAGWFLWYEALAAAHTGDFPRATTNIQFLLERAAADAEQSGGATLAFSSANHYRYALACIQETSGRTAEAIALLQEALTVDAGLYMAHVRLAGIYDEQHRTGAALEERRRAVAANPEDPSLLFDLGEALARAGEAEEAETVLGQAVAANPRNVRALYVLGFVARQMGHNVAARDAYTRFIELAPSRFKEQKVEARKRIEALGS
ncbi:MAG: tetratricopeptide repeat protein [Gemmatimonadota bacterium]|nr:tetratricopeptide repeat protein [Gemmatimonadota bacterium]